MDFPTYWYRWILLLPFYALAWQALRVVALPNAWNRLALSLGIGSAATVFLTLLSGHWASDLGVALAIASGFAAALTLLLAWRPLPAPASTWRFEFSVEHLVLLLWLAATTWMIGLIAHRFDFHDQMRVQGHPAVIEAMLRGNFPPHLQAFPEIPLKYHFGGDLFAAILAYVFGLSGIQAIDLLQIGGWFTAVLCLYTLSRSLGMNRGFSLLSLHWVLLAAGWLYLLKRWSGLPQLGADGHWPDNYVLFGRYLNPGVLSYFFQTPYALGLPVFFSYMTLFQSWLRRKSLGLLCLILALHSALSVIHITLFLGALGCAIATLALQWIHQSDSWKKRLLEIAGISIVVLAVAFALEGFFTRSASYSSGLLVPQWPPGYLRHAAAQAIDFRQSLIWYFSTLGSLLLWILPTLGLLAFSVWKRRYHPMQFFLFCFAAGSFLFPQIFHYRLSWDIIKWFTAFQISFILLILLTASSVRRFRILWIVCLLLASLLDTLPSYRMLLGLSFGQAEQYEGKQKDWFRLKIDAHQPWVQFLEAKLKARSWKDMVLASPRASDSLSIASGQSMASLDYNTVAFGVQPELIKQRRSQIQALLQNFDVAAMKASPVRWLVFRCEEYQAAFSPASRATIERSSAAGELLEIPVPAEMGCWKVFKIRD